MADESVDWSRFKYELTLVQRLRKAAFDAADDRPPRNTDANLLADAADEIERLQAEVKAHKGSEIDSEIANEKCSNATRVEELEGLIWDFVHAHDKLDRQIQEGHFHPDAKGWVYDASAALRKAVER